MKPEQLQAIRERVNKATPGPWKAEGLGSEGYNIDAKLPAETAPDVYDRLGFYGVIAQVRAGRGWNGLVANAEFIAHAREDVPALLDYADSLKKDTENIASAFSKVNRENLHLKDQIERLRGALVQVQNERLPKLYPDKEDMPKTLEYAYERGYVDALESVFQIARQALAGESE